MSWFGVRSVVRHEPGAYEERIVVVQADDFDGALHAGEQASAEYAASLKSECLGLFQCYWIPDDDIADGSLPSGTEVFSLIRASDLEPRAYLDAFFDTGDEYSPTAGEEP